MKGFASWAEKRLLDSACGRRPSEVRSSSGSSDSLAVLPDLARQGEPVHLRHHHVEHGDVERLALRDELERGGRELERDGLHLPRERVPSDDLAVRRVVVDDQDPLAGEVREAVVERDRRRHVGRGDGQRDAEGRALLLLALDRDRAAHQLHEALRDGEAEAGAAEAARRRGVDLAERREEHVHPVGRDPDARVADGELDLVRAAAGRRGVHEHHDLAALGELDRVREQVQEHLPQARLVADDPGRRVVVDEAAELELLLPRPRRDDVERSFDAVAQVERLALEIELAGLDLRVVEDVVDHVQQRVAARVDDLGELPLLAREVGAEQEVGHADHGVHRRPDLVAHRGEEGALRLRRGLGLLAGPLQLGDVVVDGVEAGVVPLEAQRHELHLDVQQSRRPCAARRVMRRVRPCPSASTVTSRLSSAKLLRDDELVDRAADRFVGARSRRARRLRGSSRSHARRRP